MRKRFKSREMTVLSPSCSPTSFKNVMEFSQNDNGNSVNSAKLTKINGTSTGVSLKILSITCDVVAVW